MDATEAVRTAQRLADEVLFPAATATDAADLLPRLNLDALADAGLYGIAGPVSAGGADLDLATTGRVIEALAGGCLTTAFVWLQHLAPVRAVAAARAELRERWLAPLCAGRVRAGIAFGGLLGAEPLLHATPSGDGWALDGQSPWVSGWGRLDLLLVAARHGPDVVWALVDAVGSPTMQAQPLRLVAVNASGTVTLRMDRHPVPADRVVGVQPHAEVVAAEPSRLRVNGSLALGLVGRCTSLLGPGPLDAELAAARVALDGAGPEAMPAARAQAAELAVRAAAALVAGTGSRSILAGQHAQRLARESLFLLVFGSRPAIRTALLRRLGATAD